MLYERDRISAHIEDLIRTRDAFDALFRADQDHRATLASVGGAEQECASRSRRGLTLLAPEPGIRQIQPPTANRNSKSE
ncbi:hypothetical protein JOF55_001782 [Haloactinomyces albus]|uniref:Uncharacterized protein n=1 Tax=Haloactinomyces albus TaxID=1352928 RepID=A0AAE4CLR1_9ACTN|nr:hypothetical protein [Haloactinomyces albus]MDR7301601.1 hypothetical protein [Haloactinomyces albus]